MRAMGLPWAGLVAAAMMMMMMMTFDYHGHSSATVSTASHVTWTQTGAAYTSRTLVLGACEARQVLRHFRIASNVISFTRGN
ncbi:hypothetical protein GGR50DRAFT_659995, partial [Xylaria sp. CBS 124048]